MPDKNHFRISGDDLGNIWVNEVLTFHASLPGMRELRLPDIVVPAGQGIADALKSGGARRLIVYVGTIDAREAEEDAVDINHCDDMFLYVDDLWPGRRYAGTLKGGSQRITVGVKRQHGHGRETDWDLGNFADQGNASTGPVTLDVTMADASAVRVRRLNASQPTLLGAPKQTYHVTAVPRGWFYPIYNFLKDLLATFRVRI
jgi:hypothetical protein